MISAEMRYEKKFETVDGYRMAYVEAGEGDPIVLLHGNPVSSYLWRNVIPHLEGLGRCIAPDLIGMGDSDKLRDSGPGRYRFVEHRRFLDALLEKIGVARDVVLVGHDWGSALAFDWANRHRDAVQGIAYFEAIVRPRTWYDYPDSRPGGAGREDFEALRSGAGEKMVLEDNLFVEQVLPAMTLRKYSDAEMEEYRRPFREPGEGRRPTLTWPRELPIEGEPIDVVMIVGDYAGWMLMNDIPKLFINGDPGTSLVDEQREFCRRWPNQREITVKGRHFLQEDSPDEIGEAIAAFVREIRAGAS
jgi:haloalkane dehalogenase